MTKAERYNDGKPQLSYVLAARYAVEGASMVMQEGCKKYDRDNWKKGMDDTALIDSMMRHLSKHLDGEFLDSETGLPHVDHALCNALFLSYHHNGRKGVDYAKEED